MPIREQSMAELQIERDMEIEDREWNADREEARRKHELDLQRVKQAVPQRHKTLTRVGIAFAKAPAFVVLAITLPLLVLRGKDIPKPLTDFLTL